MSQTSQTRILGAVLCGGASSRFDGDKRAALLDGATLQERAVAGLRGSCDAIVLCGGAGTEAPSVADRPAPSLGPLGGICGALFHARANGFTHVLTAPVDVHPMPTELVGRLAGEGAAVLAGHWLFGWWPVTLAEDLERHILSGRRSVLSWVEAAGARQVEDGDVSPVNINTRADLAVASERISGDGTAPIAGTRHYGVRELTFDTGSISAIDRAVPIECPVAIEFNGIGYAVMMATPTDLGDFAIGFAVSEGLASFGEVTEVSIVDSGGGFVVRCNVPPASLPRIMERARTRVSESGCGICGIESIVAALGPLPKVSARLSVEPIAVRRAVENLRGHQRLGRATGASHAAAFCSADGAIIEVREDVGRHNALDKLVGALAKQDRDPASGFVLLSARCSQELVEKASRTGFPMLVTISAPSSLAIDRAREAGLALVALARSDSALVLNDPGGMFV